MKRYGGNVSLGDTDTDKVTLDSRSVGGGWKCCST